MRIVLYTVYCTRAELCSIVGTVRVPNCVIYCVLHVCRIVLYTVYCTCAGLCYILCTARVPNCVIYCILHVCLIVLYIVFSTCAELCYVLCIARVPYNILCLCLLNCLIESIFFGIVPKFPKERCFLEGSVASPICPDKSNMWMEISVER